MWLGRDHRARRRAWGRSVRGGGGGEERRGGSQRGVAVARGGGVEVAPSREMAGGRGELTAAARPS